MTTLILPNYLVWLIAITLSLEILFILLKIIGVVMEKILFKIVAKAYVKEIKSSHSSPLAASNKDL